MPGQNDKEDQLRRAYGRLEALKGSIEQVTTGHLVKRTYVDEYHSILQGLERQGELLDEFKVPAGELARRSDGGNYLTGEEVWSDDLYVERAYLMAKVDGLLGYFRLRTDRRQVHLDLPKVEE